MKPQRSKKKIRKRPTLDKNLSGIKVIPTIEHAAVTNIANAVDGKIKEIENQINTNIINDLKDIV